MIDAAQKRLDDAAGHLAVIRQRLAERLPPILLAKAYVQLDRHAAALAGLAAMLAVAGEAKAVSAEKSLQ